MEQHPLAGLEPAGVFRFFEEICNIPHGSRNTKAISDYLVQFAGTGAFASGRMNGTTWSFFSPARPAMRTIPR